MSQKQGTITFVPISEEEIYRIQCNVLEYLFDVHEKSPLEEIFKGFEILDSFGKGIYAGDYINSAREKYVNWALKYTTIDELSKHYDRVFVKRQPKEKQKK